MTLEISQQLLSFSLETIEEVNDSTNVEKKGFIDEEVIKKIMEQQTTTSNEVAVSFSTSTSKRSYSKISSEVLTRSGIPRLIRTQSSKCLNPQTQKKISKTLTPPCTKASNDTQELK